MRSTREWSGQSRGAHISGADHVDRGWLDFAHDAGGRRAKEGVRRAVGCVGRESALQARPWCLLKDKTVTSSVPR